MMRDRILIIAEAGVNHNGSIELAKRLIDAAAEAGADIVKFQTFNADRLVAKSAAKAEYQRRTTGPEETQYAMLKRLELDGCEHEELMRHCASDGIRFLSTPFDLESVDMLAALGQRTWKIPSGEITNLPYLRKIGSRGEPVILSSGMAKLGEIEAALEALEAAGACRSLVTVLHCTTEYPAPFSEVNLRAMETLRRAFGVEVGYSDHTEGIAISIAAAALGARIIEKHFTLDRGMQGPDHKASIEPPALSEMVKAIRDVEAAMGDGIKHPSESEIKNKRVARKAIVAARAIAAGETLDAGNMAVKRAENGEDPMLWDRLVGRRASRDYSIDEGIVL